MATLNWDFDKQEPIKPNSEEQSVIIYPALPPHTEPLTEGGPDPIFDWLTIKGKKGRGQLSSDKETQAPELVDIIVRK